uniref:Homeobox domain protein n=1 Tax=Angiostrongylus cantonensis TaxID=6313 RepID=A0A0K0CX78_ANGCA
LVISYFAFKTTFQIDARVFHENCIRCRVCHVQLLDKCYERGGQLFCSTHYFKDCSPHQCPGCKLGISPTDMVYKLKTGMVFHVDCNVCIRCGCRLYPGEQILVDEVARTVEMDSFEYNFDSYTFSEFCDDENKFLKRRGPRTTIKQNQLDVLNRIFSSTPKPSKHARAKLALETGLSMRVIQVWFQNRRSKERRLKHLCNYLRHYEARGLLPPPMHGNSSDLTTFSHQFDEEEEED